MMMMIDDNDKLMMMNI